MSQEGTPNAQPPVDEAWADLIPAPAPPEPPSPVDEKANQLQKAASTYRNRKIRREHPDGRFDKAQRWYPSEGERQCCCGSIRHPSRSYPYSYMTHCRTVEHVARLHGVTPEELRAFLKPKKEPKPKHTRLRGPTVWQKVAEDDHEVERGQGASPTGE